MRGLFPGGGPNLFSAEVGVAWGDLDFLPWWDLETGFSSLLEKVTWSIFRWWERPFPLMPSGASTNLVGDTGSLEETEWVSFALASLEEIWSSFMFRSLSKSMIHLPLLDWIFHDVEKD